MKKFEQELNALQQQIAGMADVAQTMVNLSTGAIWDAEAKVHADVLSREEQLDLLQVQIDGEAIRLLTVYSPVASDLRFILSASRAATCIERIGDQAVNITEDVQLLADKQQVVTSHLLKKMAKVVSTMVHDATRAFLFGDVGKATATMTHDDRVDSMNDQIIMELLQDETVREAIQGPSDMAGALGQLLISRSLERMADQATNLCEEVIYMVRGDDIRHQPHPEGPAESEAE
ncbi:MAG: phosphate signaling complex protein PhoU [Planctomycetales bacterium]|nr:phosphate signaling complex protein PhoU [Planctomycetales bacterium]